MVELLGVSFWVGDELGGNLLSGAAEEGLGEGWEVLVAIAVALVVGGGR